MQPKITILWDGSEAQVRYNDAFIDAYDVLRLDMLKDAVFILTEKYNELSSEFLAKKKE